MAELPYPSSETVGAGIGSDRRRPAFAFAAGTLAVAALGAAHGGYFATAWGWAIVAFVAGLMWALTVGTLRRPRRAETVFVGALLALAGWSALTSLWGTPSAAVDEAVRVLVYVVGVATVLAVVRRAAATSLLAGVLAGSSLVALYSLATRLFPSHLGTFDSVAGYRLDTPIGYWNGLGLLCAVAFLVAVGLVASARTPWAAALAAAPAPVLLVTLYFTFSRGPWIALGIGLALAVALDPGRLGLSAAACAVGLPAAVGVIVASRFTALTHLNATLARATQDGHRVALVVVGLVLGSVALAWGLTILRGRFVSPGGLARAYPILLAAVALAAVIVGLVRLDGPVGAARRAWHSFATPLPKHQVDLTRRLFSFSGNHRADLWSVGVHEFTAHPLLGSGAGSYESYWLLNRPYGAKVRDAHSLYLETLAELGVVGFVLLVAALGTPLVAALRARRRRGVAAAAGAYAAYLAGAGVDWDWEIVAVTLAALLVGSAILVSARSDEDERREPSPRLRYGLLAGTLAVGAAGFVFLVGNMFLSRASSAAMAGNWTASAHDARRAASWLPWSTQPWQQLGEAQLGEGNTAGAAASFRNAIRKDGSDSGLWLDLARASTGKQQTVALARAANLDPLGPDIAAFRRELGSSSSISLTVGHG